MVSVVKGEHNVKLGARVVGLFDPKCDEEPKIYPGQGWFQRVPGLNAASFEELVAVMAGIMRPGVDFVIVLDGKVQSNQEVFIEE